MSCTSPFRHILTASSRATPLRRHLRPAASAAAAGSHHTSSSLPPSARPFSSAARRHEQTESNSEDSPRWASTPIRMVAPVRIRPRADNYNFKVNQDPSVLNRAYNRFLGDGADRLLSDEVKWLAVTHKSFDHGRRGFNDRLAYLGKRIVELQTSLALLNPPPSLREQQPHVEADQFGRVPFEHPALEGLPNLSYESKATSVDITRLAKLAESYGLQSVVRWKPRKAQNLKSSGEDAVLASSMYAVIGALALERGGEVANKAVRERILVPLGLL